MNTKIYVKINSIDRVKTFVKDTETFSSEIDAVYGRYTIDAKSIMGLFSIDVTKELEVVIHSDDQDEILRFNEVMSKYVD